MRYLLSIVLFLFCFVCHSQYKHGTRWIKADSLWSDKRTDNLGQILLSAYLDGKINGFKFAVADSVVKWETLELPQEWDKTKNYRDGDEVAFSGERYLAIGDNKGISPAKVGENSEGWYWQIAKSRVPISRKWFFPSEKDTLPKTEFLQRMVIGWPENYEEWTAGTEYYLGDRVSYDGQHFESVNDSNTGHLPNRNRSDDNWQIIYDRIQFAQLGDCHDISLLLNFSVSPQDTIWTPQMISVHIASSTSNTGFPIPVCHFYYKDVVAYLQAVSQPISTSFKYGYLNNGLFEFNAIAQIECMKWIKSKIKQKVLKLSEDNIITPALYAKWFASENFDPYEWGIFQHPATHAVKLVRRTNSYEQIFLSLQIDQVERLLTGEKFILVEPVNYSSMLSAWEKFSGPLSDDTDWYDSLAPLEKFEAIGSALRNEYVIIEKYYARLDSAFNEDMAALMPGAWSEIEKAYFSGTLKDVQIPNSFFQDNYQWSKMKLKDRNREYPLEENFSLSGGRFQGVYFLSLPTKFQKISVTYQKEATVNQAPAKVYFEPLTIGFIYSDANSEMLGSFSGAEFKWGDLKQILIKQGKKFKKFLDAVENGKLAFSDFEVLYGMKEK
jgi:hypothetical protein